ncbi:MAG: PadR family transcriptional regulator [Geodermatophilaceae bacterium]|nr:PadR family transcriptional regulator [Geodermatophilaceae bacterium]
MSQDRGLPATSYAVLGLLTFGRELSGYELKQWADSTLRFYWTAPAMSQIYTELKRLAERGLVLAREVDGGPSRTTTRYRVSAKGTRALRRWLADSDPGFPLLKHPIALRLLLGHLLDPAQVREMLEAYDAALAAQRRDLRAVLDGIDNEPAFEFPAHVARWGLSYYDSEEDAVRRVLSALPEPLPRRAQADGASGTGPAR